MEQSEDNPEILLRSKKPSLKLDEPAQDFFSIVPI
jgi:hypothetical protein